MVEEIKALKELLDMGAITQEEFDAKKAELLSRPVALSQATPNADAMQRESEKSKIAAGLLAIFLGSLGIHKFYLGYAKEGLTMLLVTIFGSILFGLGAIAMGIVALVEGVLYLTKSDVEFDAVYVQGDKGWF